MRFLCQHHRSELTSSLEKAERSWKKTLDAARKEANSGNWERALFYSGNSIEIADIILSNRPIRENSERYIKTAIEFAHALRNSKQPADLTALYEIVCTKLTTVPDNIDSFKNLKPLEDVLFEPIDRVNSWMAQWHDLLRTEPKYMH